MENCSLLPAFQHRQTATTGAISRTLMHFYLKKARTCMAYTPMRRSTSWQRRQKICSVLCLRCSRATPAADQDWELVEKTRFASRQQLSSVKIQNVYVARHATCSFWVSLYQNIKPKRHYSVMRYPAINLKLGGNIHRREYSTCDIAYFQGRRDRK